MTYPLHLYHGEPSRGKSASIETTVSIRASSSTIPQIQADIRSYLNANRRELGLKKLPEKLKLDIRFVYSTYAKKKLNGRSKERFFSKRTQSEIDDCEMKLSIHGLSEYIKRILPPPAKKQRQKLGDLRSGINMSEAITTQQGLFQNIVPENMNLRAGTTNLLNSATSAINNTAKSNQMNALKIKLRNHLANVFTTASEIVELSSLSIEQQENLTSELRKSVRLSIQKFESGISPLNNQTTTENNGNTLQLP